MLFGRTRYAEARAGWRQSVFADNAVQKSYVQRLTDELEMVRCKDFGECHGDSVRAALMAANAEQVQFKTLALEKETQRLAQMQPRVAQAQAEEKQPIMDSTPFMDKTIYRMTLIANRKRLQESTVKEISP